MQAESAFRSNRGKRLRKAVSTALLSKGASVLLQVVSIPLAIRILGPEQYGLYALATSFLALFAFANVGAGPALVRSLAAADAAGDLPRQRRLLISALIAIALGFIFITLVYGISVSTGLAQKIFGRALYAHFLELRSLIWLCLGATVLIMVGNIFSSVLTGFQLQHVTNLLGIIGIILSAVGIVIAMKLTPSVTSFVTFLYGGQIVGLLLCAVYLWRQRPDLFKWRNSGVSLLDIRSFISTGLVFIFIQVGGTVQREMVKLMLGSTMGLIAVGRLAALFQLVIILFGFLTMVSMPLFPALVEANERGDLLWIKRTLKRFMAIVFVGSVFFILVFWLLGNDICRILYGSRFEFSTFERIAMAIYFSLSAVAHVIDIGLMGLGHVRFTAALFGGEIITTASLFSILGAQGIGKGFWLLTASVTIVTLLIGGAKLLRCMAITEGNAGTETIRPKSPEFSVERDKSLP